MTDILEQRDVLEQASQLEDEKVKGFIASIELEIVEPAYAELK